MIGPNYLNGHCVQCCDRVLGERAGEVVCAHRTQGSTLYNILEIITALRCVPSPMVSMSVPSSLDVKAKGYKAVWD